MEAVAIRDRIEEPIINLDITTGNLIITTTEISILRGRIFLRLRIALKVFIVILRILFHMMGVIVFLRMSSSSTISSSTRPRTEISSCKFRIILVTIIEAELIMEIIMFSSKGYMEIIMVMGISRIKILGLILCLSKRAFINSSSSSSSSSSSRIYSHLTTHSINNPSSLLIMNNIFYLNNSSLSNYINSSSNNKSKYIHSQFNSRVQTIQISLLINTHNN